jgi:glycosyltransferase involved in cell wall biosynthesis
MGNSRYHDFIYPLLFRHRGVLVLHDLVLHHSRLASYLQSPEVAAYRADMGDRGKRTRALTRLQEYVAEVEAAYPRDGATVAEVAVRMGGGRLLYAYPLYELLVRASRMSLVHSHPAREQVLEACPQSVVHRVRMGVELPRPVPREEARQRLGLGSGWILASFGLVTPEKRISMTLRCLKRLLNEGLELRYILVGGTVPHYDALAEARQIGVAHQVTLTGRVSADDFRLHAFASDLCLNLRYPSAGETSASLLSLLATGSVVLVTDQTHYSDFPDSVVSRVRLQGDEDGLFCDIMDLIRQPRRRRSLEESSRKFVSSEHSLDVMAEDYASCLEEAAGLPAPKIELPRHLES